MEYQFLAMKFVASVDEYRGKFKYGDGQNDLHFIANRVIAASVITCIGSVKTVRFALTKRWMSARH